MDNFDVIIVGAGLSGIGAAHHLQKRSPDRSYVILEGRSAIGGTWDLFRYPGIRSDSDMHTLGYAFKPWTQAKAIADGPSILEYVRETAREGGIDRHIRFDTKVVRADWDSDTARWTVETTTPDGPKSFTANFVLMCSGYYDYSGGHRPTWDGEEAFKGDIVHPQHWPESLDYKGKRVVVIGSGATAVTLVPAMTDKAAHVTMLQRSPSYVVARPGVDAMANTLRKRLPHMLAYQIIRWRNVLIGMLMFRVMRAKPQKWNKTFIDLVKGHMGPDYDVETHFTPKYNVWDQRLCLVPDSDLFEALKGGKADVVTDTIERFTATGIRLSSGKELAARCDRHRHGAEADTGWRHGDERRRPHGPSGRDAGLQGDDVLRRAQHGGGVRLHQRQLDAEGRPHQRIRLSPAEPHAPHAHRHGDAGRTFDAGGGAALARLLLRLRAALAGPLPQAGRRRAVEAAPELRARYDGAALRQAGGRGVDLLQEPWRRRRGSGAAGGVRGARALLGVALALAVAGSAVAQSASDPAPARKPGLWTMTVTSGPTGAGQAAEVCVGPGPATPQSLLAGAGLPKGCTGVSGAGLPGGGYRLRTQCETSGLSLAGTLDMEGDFQARYRGKVTASLAGSPAGAPMIEAGFEAVWSGACPAELGPGDSRMNGKIRHAPAEATAPPV